MSDFSHHSLDVFYFCIMFESRRCPRGGAVEWRKTVASFNFAIAQVLVIVWNIWFLQVCFLAEDDIIIIITFVWFTTCCKYRKRVKKYIIAAYVKQHISATDYGAEQWFLYILLNSKKTNYFQVFEPDFHWLVYSAPTDNRVGSCRVAMNNRP